MVATVAYALRRTSARVVLVLAIGGLYWSVWRALRTPGTRLFLIYEGEGRFFLQSATRWDLSVAALGLAVALVVSAALWYERSTMR